ncbi:hypothetical protein K0M31_003390 [Melipona bicolor]|uniref:Uncharacterized protein n=1 Tax=Melipona bicolor TaxID=60889 RepID=A0AA40FZ34_9HYME|nr:hypothetical protein K0M31_003390 [Melipona bicolor]
MSGDFGKDATADVGKSGSGADELNSNPCYHLNKHRSAWFLLSKKTNDSMELLGKARGGWKSPGCEGGGGGSVWLSITGPPLWAMVCS